MGLFNYLLILVILLPAPFVFFWLIYYWGDKRARKIIEQLPQDADAKFEDVKIWFKGYDMLKRVNQFQIDPAKALYSYNLADLFIFEDGLVIVGKFKSYGKIRLLPPFAICRSSGLNRLSVVPNRTKYLGMEPQGPDIDIGFKDAEYTNTIKLAVKNVGMALHEKMLALGY